MFSNILWDLTGAIQGGSIEKQMKKLSLDHLGEGERTPFSFWGYVATVLRRPKRVSPLVSERKRFEEEVRQQFLKLKEKGLGIHVFTL